MNIITEEYIATIISRLPSGAGFNSPWEHVGTSRTGTLHLRGGYQHMNPEGYYDGWVTVNLRVQYTGGTVCLPSDWRCTLGTDNVSRRVQRRDPGLREYINDCIHEALRAQ